MLAILFLLLILFVPIVYLYNVIYGIRTLQKPISETTSDERYDAWSSIIAVVGGILFTMWLMS
jgi:succinate dehydrogenase/fumarate reductase cytochrome b subunit